MFAFEIVYIVPFEAQYVAYAQGGVYAEHDKAVVAVLSAKQIEDGQFGNVVLVSDRFCYSHCVYPP
jgi:hypothetical protein